ncbi:hypothetical protein AVEN_256355-1 [Araneus ventricosus]|uniref:Uncharacterized protein n=1 Tax=Araneus ventricosus TaxID=182803 RepID=A0A4Y2U3T0_ARAVE|nr:hypothetical protein AVEN_256355-1 [Araneus ventricosus]
MNRFLSCHWLITQSFLPHSTLAPLYLHEINCSSQDVPDWLQSSTFASHLSCFQAPDWLPPTSSTDQTKNSGNTLLMHKLPSFCCKFSSIVGSGSHEPQAPLKISFV